MQTLDLNAIVSSYHQTVKNSRFRNVDQVLVSEDHEDVLRYGKNRILYVVMERGY